MSARARVLLVEDDEAIARSVRRSLEAHGYAVLHAPTAATAREAVASQPFDVILLDLMLPDGDGVTLCRPFHETSGAAIIVLSALDEESDKIAALDEGADDYLTKPFGLAELHARIRVALRHQAIRRGAPVLRHGLIQLDPDTRSVVVHGRAVHLTPKEYDLADLLVRQAGRVLTYRYILANVWGPEYADDTHVLRTVVYQLRAKLQALSPEAAGQLITEQSVGYRLIGAEDTRP